ncbi:MAG: hypothetical protein JWO08_2670 [Verrucomicrobiaceae bacterium]|nr:hypothetical protein [Verrucomicrobiaceae bacterium]
MTRYQNNSGRSGVLAYESGKDFIKVKFHDGTYLYTHSSAGRAHIKAMKALASAGRGLSTYISQHVKDGFEAKIR